MKSFIQDLAQRVPDSPSHWLSGIWVSVWKGKFLRRGYQSANPEEASDKEGIMSALGKSNFWDVAIIRTWRTKGRSFKYWQRTPANIWSHLPGTKDIEVLLSAAGCSEPQLAPLCTQNQTALPICSHSFHLWVFADSNWQLGTLWGRSWHKQTLQEGPPVAVSQTIFVSHWCACKNPGL